MEPTSWEDCITDVIWSMRKDYLKYIESAEFELEWKHWGKHYGGIKSPFRRKLIEILDINGQHDFVLETPTTRTTRTIRKVIEHSVVAQLNLFNRMEIHDSKEIKRTRVVAIDIIDDAISGLEPWENNSLRSELRSEYKQYWNAAEKILIQWRKSISDQKYALCRKRLMEEYDELRNK